MNIVSTDQPNKNQNTFESSILDLFLDPQRLIQFKEADTELPQKMLQLIEKEQNERHINTRKALETELFMHKLGLILGFLLFLSLIFLTAYLFYINKDWFGVGILVVFSAYLGAFMYYNRNNPNDGVLNVSKDIAETLKSFYNKK